MLFTEVTLANVVGGGSVPGFSIQGIILASSTPGMKTLGPPATTEFFHS
jgi:hypothetical protein